MAHVFTEWGPCTSFGKEPSTEMVVSWRSATISRESWLKYGTDRDNERKLVATQAIPDEMHVFTIKGLNPATTYRFEISRDPGTVYSFTTAPRPGTKVPFSFTVNGDMHAYPCNNIARYFDLMLELDPGHAFGICVGDCINDGNDPDHWEAFFRDANHYLHQKPLMNATGNHDSDNPDKYARYLRAWHHPYVDPGNGAYYAMVYANAVFIIVDSSNGGRRGLALPSDEQYEWLEATLQAHALKDKWVFVFFHHQVYSTGDFSCDSSLHEFWRPICQQYHVDAVFYGHDHHYECFWVDRDADWGGTLYIVAGGGGGQHHIDHGIMGDRDGKTKYVWPGRFLNVRKHGVPAPSATISAGAMGFRNDALVRECQLVGVLEPNFVHVSIDGDVMELRSIGWQKQVYHHVKVQRAGAGRKYSPACELALVDY